MKSNEKKKTKAKENAPSYDVVVIGGGPAGMMAAGRAAEQGATVLLIEKNASLGKKLLITGGGRCNITNAEPDVRKMIAKYGPKGKALFGAFNRFGVSETLTFFQSHNLPIKVEAEKRAFPVSNKALDVWKTLVDYLKTGKVTIQYNSPVSEILTSLSVIPSHVARERHDEWDINQDDSSRVTDYRNDKISLITGIKVGSKIITAKNYILATGGKSRPETGSTGEGFDWLRAIGHTVVEQNAALVPITTQEVWQKELLGLSFPNVKLTILQDKKKVDSKTGKVLFTHFGLSGPLVLNMSKSIQELHAYSPVSLSLDLYPELDLEKLDQKILTVFANGLNKKIRNNMGELVPPKMIPTLLELTGVDPEKTCNAITKQERLTLAKQLKNFSLTVTGFLGTEKAITTSGGVSLKEVDFKTCQSKLYSNLYLVGDVLDFDRPSGGFSLQICWTTGYLAGENACSELQK